MVAVGNARKRSTFHGAMLEKSIVNEVYQLVTDNIETRDGHAWALI